MPVEAYIFILPYLAFGILILFGHLYLKNKAPFVAITAISASLILSLRLVKEQLLNHGQTVNLFFPWFRIETSFRLFDFNFGFFIDPLTAFMVFMVSGVSLLIFIYSIGYMEGDPRYSRFFAYLSLFAASMLGVVLSNNLLMLYIFWELMGLASYLLIGFWFEKESVQKACRKAFMVTRVGDVGFFIGMLMLFARFGTLEFQPLFQAVEKVVANDPEAARYVTVATMFLFFGPVGKSAQFPLHVWLPDAMEGPTPVSALIHAATMVAAGVFLVGRMFPVFHMAQWTMNFITYLASISLFLAALMAVVQEDIKRVLAYSTMSQLGYMLLALGAGAYTAGMFHLLTHAYFKALLFLGSGAVIHALHTNNIWEMGGLFRKMKVTAVTFLIGSAALMGLPPMSGFFSKDEIITAVFEWGREHGNYFPFILAVAGAFLTAFYMTRLCIVAFFFKPRKEHQVHESPVMNVPLILLAIPAAFFGFIGAPFNPFFQRKVYFHHFHHLELNPFLLFLSIAVALLGLLAGWLIYAKGIVQPHQIVQLPGCGVLYKALKERLYIDHIYLFLVRIFLFGGSLLFAFVDRSIVDLIINAIGWLTQQFSKISNFIDRFFVDGLVNFTGWLFAFLGNISRRIQTGSVQNYMFFVAFVLALLIYYMR